MKTGDEESQAFSQDIFLNQPKYPDIRVYVHTNLQKENFRFCKFKIVMALELGLAETFSHCLSQHLIM